MFVLQLDFYSRGLARQVPLRALAGPWRGSGAGASLAWHTCRCLAVRPGLAWVKGIAALAGPAWPQPGRARTFSGPEWSATECRSRTIAARLDYESAGLARSTPPAPRGQGSDTASRGKPSVPARRRLPPVRGGARANLGGTSESRRALPGPSVGLACLAAASTEGHCGPLQATPSLALPKGRNCVLGHVNRLPTPATRYPWVPLGTPGTPRCRVRRAHPEAAGRAPAQAGGEEYNSRS